MYDMWSPSQSLGSKCYKQPLCLSLTFDLEVTQSLLHGTLPPYGRKRNSRWLQALVLFVICINYSPSLKSSLDQGTTSLQPEVFLHHTLLLSLSPSASECLSVIQLSDLYDESIRYANRLDANEIQVGVVSLWDGGRVWSFLEVCCAITLPSLLISCASVAQCGTSSSHCLLFPPPSSQITVSNLLALRQVTEENRTRRKKTTESRFREK